MLAFRMAAGLTDTDVDRIAALAHLELTADERTLFARQLADILTYAARLQDVDTTGVSATWHPVASHAPLRADQVRPSLPRSAALANAPDRDDGFFKVPKVIG